MWIIDAMVSGTFITLLLFIMLGTSDQLTQKYVQADSEVSFANTLLSASDSLVLTPGRPGNWELLDIPDDGVASVGLAYSPNVLSSQKLAKLESLNSTNYTAIKYGLGLGALNVSIEVMALGDGTPIYSFGVKPANTSRATVFERLAVLDDGRPVLMRLEVG